MRLLVFGLGYSGKAIAQAAAARDAAVMATGRDGNVPFDAAEAALVAATHIVSTIPPGADDPVLSRYGDALTGKTLVYLSSTGVYGDAGGAWVDESARLLGRRPERIGADTAWLALGARVLRLPGIYGPGRSVLDRLAAGTGHRTGLADQIFSRIHVDDIATAVLAAFDGPPGAYNIADDRPAPQDDVVAAGCALLGLPLPPIVALSDLSPAARAFYAENRRVATGKARRVLGWAPAYPDLISGLRAINAISSPANASTAPPPASSVQR